MTPASPSGPTATSTTALIRSCTNSGLRKATRHLGQLFDDIIAPSGLRATQHGLLSQIKSLERPTMKELARALVMDLSALSHTLTPLVRDAYVELVPDAKDRRAKRVVLTAAGKRKLTETTRLWKIAQARADAALGADRAEALRDLLAIVASDEFGAGFKAARRPKPRKAPRGTAA